MPLNYLFTGMESCLDGDIKISNTVAAPGSNESASSEPTGDLISASEISDQADSESPDEKAATQTNEVADEANDAAAEAKDTEIATQMLARTCSLYMHVKKYGIDRTFVDLYNKHGELDKVCGIRFPSCEAMSTTNSRYNNYNTAFIAAMEDDSGKKKTWWQRFKKLLSDIWEWIKKKASAIWEKIVNFFRVRFVDLKKVLAKIKANYAGQLDTTVDIPANTELTKVADETSFKHLLERNSRQLAKGREILPLLISLSDTLQREAKRLNDEDGQAAKRVKEVADKWTDAATEYNKIIHDKEHFDNEAKKNTLGDLLKKLDSCIDHMDRDTKTYDSLKKDITEVTARIKKSLDDVADNAPDSLALPRLMMAVQQPENIIKSIVLSGKGYLEKAAKIGVELKRVVKKLDKDSAATNGSESFNLAFL